MRWTEQDPEYGLAVTEPWGEGTALIEIVTAGPFDRVLTALQEMSSTPRHITQERHPVR